MFREMETSSSGGAVVRLLRAGARQDEGAVGPVAPASRATSGPPPTTNPSLATDE